MNIPCQRERLGCICRIYALPLQDQQLEIINLSEEQSLAVSKYLHRLKNIFHESIDAKKLAFKLLQDSTAQRIIQQKYICFVK